MQVFRRPRFLFDVAEELTRLNELAGPEVAERWYISLKETIRQLRIQPFLGRERKDLKPPGLRSWRLSDYPRWLIFYGIDGDNNLVLYRVRQGTMNLGVVKMES
jgi:plasmid stabilization system protein ParE